MRIQQSIRASLVLFVSGLMLLPNASLGQSKEDRPSPPRTAEGVINGNSITIAYSSPSVSGREIWGKMVPYGEVWRTGANEATTISLSKDAKVNGEILKAGTYAVFTIPEADHWTIIFNTVHNQWGAYNYDAKYDALRVKAKTEPLSELTERFQITINEQEHVVAIAWDKLRIPIRVE